MNCRKCGVALPEKAAFCPACGVKQAVSARKPKRRGNGQGTVVKRGKTYVTQGSGQRRSFPSPKQRLTQ